VLGVVFGAGAVVFGVVGLLATLGRLAAVQARLNVPAPSVLLAALLRRRLACVLAVAE
jgi:hypothetical protein